MNSALFTYNRTEKVNNQEVVNANYVNPAHVISMYWAVTENGARVLNIFTSAVVADDKGGSKTMRLTLGERTGERFVEHVEAFYSLMLNPRFATPVPVTENRNAGRNTRREGPRSYSHVIDPDLETPATQDAEWETASA